MAKIEPIETFQCFEIYELTPKLAKEMLETGQMNLEEDKENDNANSENARFRRWSKSR